MLLSGPLFVFGCITMLYALAVLARGVRGRRRAKRVESVPVSRLASVTTPAAIAVRGRASSFNEPLTAPLTGRPALYYRVMASEWVSSGKSGHYREALSEARGESLLLDDGSGARALLLLADANVVAKEKTGLCERKAGIFTTTLDETGAAYLEARGLTVTLPNGKQRSYRLSEAIVAPGDEVYACGRALPPDGPERLVVLRPGEGSAEELIVSNLPGAELALTLGETFRGARVILVFGAVLAAGAWLAREFGY
ncbi:MAG: hypothetical protein OZ921_14055 [Sorangiineae bacterium]|nr:hypothetical protein [Polyangiaceae bacterium]MEB2323632.1 hypothetical protein [Sorangiineae bacterium]